MSVAATSAQPALPTGISEKVLFGTALRKSKWPTNTIPVCWENPAPANAENREVVRKAVEETWEYNSKIRFVGWSNCDEDSRGIRVLISDERAHTKALGRYLDKMPNGLVLNFDFKNWSRGCQSRITHCLKALAAHEFGHALGFSHEQNRDDTPNECKSEAEGTVGDYKVTAYDPTSIMNYCSMSWTGDGKLSPFDILAVNKFYDSL